MNQLDLFLNILIIDDNTFFLYVFCPTEHIRTWSLFTKNSKSPRN